MDKDESGPERTCLVTRRKGSPETMIRFVRAPDGSVVPDLRRRLPGRGVWVAAAVEIIGKAAATQAFSRGFKGKAAAPSDLAAQVAGLLVEDALQSLAMANKAGVVTTGFAKVEAALASGPLALLLHAEDGGEDGIRKLDAALRRRMMQAPGKGTPPISMKLFTSRQLDLALGRTNVIHAALAEGPASKAFLTRCRRLISYRSTPPHLEAGAGTTPG